jgi:large subunit ribosomal protein L25
MEVGKLTVSRRHGTGKGAARQLRTQGLVPGVCYGAAIEAPMPIAVNFKALKASLDPAKRSNTVIELTVEDAGQPSQKITALLKEYQVDPIRRDVTHVDLQAIDPSKPIVVEVPIELVGKPKGAVDGGQLHIVRRSLTIKVLPANIPAKFELDVSPLGISDVFHVSDLPLPAGIEAVTARTETIVTCTAPEVEKPTAAEAAAAAAPAEGAAAAPAAGAKDAKPAAGGKAAPAAPAAKGGKAAPAAPAAKGGKK